MINRQLVHYDTAGQRVIIQPGDLTNVGGDVYAISPGGAVTSVADVPNTIPVRDADGGFEVGYLQVDTTPPVVETDGVGKIIWNDTDGTLEFGAKGGNVVIQIGQEEVLRVKNDSGGPLTAGQVVYISGSNGTNLLAQLANASAEATSSSTIGIVTEPIANNGHGFITTFGLVRNIDTNHLTEGAVVWLSTVSGQTTSTRPSAPNHGVVLGFCVRKSATVGVIFVRVDNGWELDELHNVLISGVAAGDLLVRNAGNTLWENKAPSTQPWVLKAGDAMTGALSITNAAVETLLTITNKGIGELPIKVRTANGNQAEAGAQAGMDFGFNNTYRVTFATAATTGVGSPFDGSAYFYVAGLTNGLRFISDLITRPIGFWNGPSTLVARCYNGAFQVGSATTATSSSVAGLLYSGKAGTTVQLRLGDDGGYCWSMGRDNVSTGDFVLTATSNAGANYFSNAFRIMWANGNVALGLASATAVLHLKAGTASASTAPLKLTSGTLLTSAEAGAVEYDGTDWYMTDSTPTRRTVDYLPTVTSSATPVTVPAKGGFVRVVGAAGAKTVNLPALSGVKTGTRVIVKDSAGNAAGGTITITPNGTDTIDGAATATITTNYGVVRLFATGSAGRWEIW